jgi:hypothetical protein
MFKRVFFCILLILGQLVFAGGEQNAAPSTPAPVIKDRVPLFVTTLSYLPSIMISAMPRIRFANQIQAELFRKVLLIGCENLKFGEEDYVKPGNYNLFQVIPSQDAKLFVVNPGETPRSAVTWPEMKAPIMINQSLVNNPSNTLTIPDVVQLLIHEVGKKIPGVAHNQQLIQMLDSMSAAVAKTINQDYMTVELAPGEVLHIQNSPSEETYQKIMMADSKYAEQVNRFRALHMRYGREILMFHENEIGFSFLPQLQAILLEEIKSLKRVTNAHAFVAVASNIEQIIVDRNVSDRPLIRLRAKISERAYRVSNADKESKDQNPAFMSFSSMNNDEFRNDDVEETLENRVELVMQLNKDRTIGLTKREVIDSDPKIEILNSQRMDTEDAIRGSMTVKIPQNLKSILDHNLRAYMHIRMAAGIARVEVTRLEMKDDTVTLEYQLPSKMKSNQAYFVEELLLKNKGIEVLADLPETILVNDIATPSSGLSVEKFELLQGDQWIDLHLNDNVGPALSDTSLYKLREMPGFRPIQPGVQKFRMHFKSGAPLAEIYFSHRKNYLTHDPLLRSTIQGPLGHMGFIGQAFLQSQKSLSYMSAVYQQVVDEVIHIPASEMRQELNGNDLTIEFSLAMDVMPDKGPSTYDAGIRYLGKIMAVNQQLAYWEMANIKAPVFGLEATHYGAKSCSDYFKGKSP